MMNPNNAMRQTLINSLKEFFYYNQYDEERYPHFMACDRDYEHDEEGNKHYYYIFYYD